MKLLLSTLFTLLISLITFSQTGPGGILSSAEVEVWLDANRITSASDGGTISLWDDVSGNGNHLIQLLNTRRPTYFQSGQNSKPYVEFSADYMTSGSIPDLETDQITWLYVGSFNSTPTSYEMVISQSYTSNNYQYVTFYNHVLNGIRNAAYTPTYKAVHSAPFSTNTTFNMTIRDMTNLSSYTNGSYVYTNSTLASYTPSGHQHMRIGAIAGPTPTYYFNGKIYETIAFSGILNDAEINILSNYISSKYATPIGLDLYAYDSNHGENLIGIGQEANGSNLTATGQGIVTISGANDLQDGEYLILGDDNVSLANTSPDVPASEPIGTNRFQRVWRVGENQGDVGTITLTLDISTYRPGTNPLTTKLLISASGDFSADGNATSGVYDAGTETVTFTINLNDGDYISFCGSEGDIESTGVTSDWSLTTTWNCGCLPSLSDSVTILNGHTVNVDAAGAIARTIVVQTTGTLDFTGGDLTIEENIISNGTLNVTSGTLDFDGPSIGQTFTITGIANIDNLTVSNSNGLALSGGTFVINGTFSMNGNIDNSGATEFIINSSASGDGRIAAIPGSINFSDPITIRRYLPAGNADYRNLTPTTFPFTLQQWDDELVISGDGYPDGCALSGGTCFYSFKKWNGSAFFDIPAINNTHTVGTGFHAFIGDDLNTFGGSVLESSGSINKGTFSQVGYTNWNFLGNPYPSAIDFSALQTVSFRMDDYYYVYDPAQGAYDWYDGTGGTGNLDQYISMGQAYWVAPPSGATQPLQANYNELVKTDQTPTWKSLSSSNGLYLKVSTVHNNWGNRICFNTHPDALVGADTIDIPHLVTPQEFAPYIATTDEYGNSLTVSYFPEDEITVAHPIYVNTPFTDYYTVTVENLENFNQYTCVYLLDLKSNEKINLREEGSYTFFVDQTKSDETRFLLVCSNDGTCNTTDGDMLGSLNKEIESGSVKVQQMNNFFNITFDYPTGERSSIEVLNSLGQVVYNSGEFNMSKGTKSISIDNGTSGVHFIRILHGSELTTEKVFIAN
ncbi:MAG: T9SS type A sorting domain-containing protein [Crocinitomicaceae bacterium]|nr:T9SS type A sorting domain-containing protein [Crocinitomicaceae bacterium]